MSTHSSHHRKLSTRLKHFGAHFGRYWRASGWHRVGIALTSLFLITLGTMYGISQWYINSQKDEPLKLGTSFIPAYAESLGLEPQPTMDALINDLGVRHFRLVSYWNQHEPAQDQYDFSLLDWQFAKAEAAGAKISLSLGLRQPRWPECHMPDWAKDLPTGTTDNSWQDQLLEYIGVVVNRYKLSPAIESYQLENEYFLRGFGHCTDFDRDRLIEEFNLVKQLDPDHPVIVARSNNAIGFPVGQPTPDEFGISIYKRTWDAGHTRRYLEYPFPAWFYGFVAGTQKIMTGRDMIIHELQAEAWPPNYQRIPEASLDEQNKSLDAKRLEHRIAFGKATGMREIYLWGSEYWYYRLVKLNDPSVWNVVKDAFQTANTEISTSD